MISNGVPGRLVETRLNKGFHMPANELLLTIDYKEPVEAAVLGELLSAIGNDYRRLYGCELIVTEIRQGSIIAILKEIADNTDSINHLIDFLKNIAGIKNLLLGSKGKKGSRSKTTKTIRAIANTALKTGGEVYMEHESANGEKLKVHVNPAEALLIVQPPQDRAHYATSRIVSQAISEASLDDGFIADLARVAFKSPAAGGDVIGADSNPQLQLLRELISAIRSRSDGEQWIAKIAQDLRDRGHSVAAQMLEGL
ncbi:hypothetical protein KGY14_07425 [Ameyamaea chiangmaiensis]|uniref:hypothetical protein n=1 Tax=Ameyamaea chiangmaiensis TaxID=442969 RepID=UPI001BAFFA61|nr:hypothetical protein [Ameyamaea chiangmaiensis]MBS4075018.1 hypothetical protein [Ameyamaea chiangmaiensis]